MQGAEEPGDPEGLRGADLLILGLSKHFLGAGEAAQRINMLAEHA